MPSLIAVMLLAGTIQPLDLKTLPARSSLIVTGRVLATRTRTGLVFFDHHLTPGESGVFFLTPSPRGRRLGPSGPPAVRFLWQSRCACLV